MNPGQRSETGVGNKIVHVMAYYVLFGRLWIAVAGNAADAVVSDGDVVTAVLKEHVEKCSAAYLRNQLWNQLLGVFTVITNVAGYNCVGYCGIVTGVQSANEIGSRIHLFQRRRDVLGSDEEG